MSKLLRRYGGGAFRVVTNHGQFVLAQVLSEGGVRLPDFLILPKWRFKTFRTHLNKHFASIPDVTHALDKAAPPQSVQNVRNGSGGKAGFFRKLARSHGAVGMGEDQVDALGIGRVEPDSLRDRLVQKHGLSGDSASQIQELIEQLPPASSWFRLDIG